MAMNFSTQKIVGHTHPQPELARVSVNVMATLREREIDALPFNPDPELTRRIADALTLQRWARKAALKAQERRWAALADVVRTPEQTAAIAADQARRIKAMGGR